MKTILLCLTAILPILLIAGCSGDDHGSMMTNPGSTNFTIAPADGANGVRLDDGIILTFSKSVDKSVTEGNFHLISERDMADSACPVNMMMGHGDMDMAMGDSSMMDHLVDRHNTGGRFYWNGDSTQCTFQPDSMMQSGMRYMVHMGPEMTRMMEGRMGDMGMMGGHGGGMMNDHMILHFQTIDTTAVGSGHDGHH
ncbi:MAG TPA: hypothetical protein VI932_10050 [Bacteroidota bacterium]|nr:hypothetical protein [Bacteroidota bacterium]